MTWQFDQFGRTVHGLAHTLDEGAQTLRVVQGLTRTVPLFDTVEWQQKDADAFGQAQFLTKNLRESPSLRGGHLHG